VAHRSLYFVSFPIRGLFCVALPTLLGVCRQPKSDGRWCEIPTLFEVFIVSALFGKGVKVASTVLLHALSLDLLSSLVAVWAIQPSTFP
jgi:hypothetical protein